MMRFFGKRFFSLFLALILCLTLFPAASAEDAGTIAPAEEGSIRPVKEGDALPRYDETQDGETSGQCGDALTWSFDETTGTLTITGSGEMWDYGVNEAPWSGRKDEIRTLLLPEALTRIGKMAFYSLRSLSSVEIPVSVKTIGYGAFIYCGGLLSVTIPGNVETIESSAFSGCFMLESVTIQEGVSTLASGAFTDCEALKTVYLPASLSSLASLAFRNCGALQDIYYAGTIESWKSLSLDYDVTKVTVHCSDGDILVADIHQCGDDLTWTLDEQGTLTVSGTGDMWDFSWEGGPWRESGAITSVVLEPGVTSVGKFAFYDCTMETISIPEGVTRFGTYAFGYCAKLQTVLLPASLQDFGFCTFHCCSSLAAFEMAEGNTTYCIRDGMLYTADQKELLCCPAGFSGPYVVPDGVISIGSHAFGSCQGLTGITIPASVTQIGQWAFHDCDSLPAFVISEENAYYRCVDGVLYTKDLSTLIRCPEGKAGRLVIQPGCTKTNFQSCLNCENLTGVSFPEGFSVIDRESFINCMGLTEVSLPNSLTIIDDRGFSGCSSLSRLVFRGNAPQFGDDVFNFVTATAFYPEKDESWTDDVRKDYSGTITWKGYAAAGGTLAVDDATACVGREFTLDLSLDENPGVMALNFRLDFDPSVLEFVGAEDGALTGWVVNTEKAVLEWDSDRDQTETGTLVKLRFLVKEDAVPGTTVIGIAELQAGNFHEESVLFDLAPGTVKLVPHTAGDANGDGEVDIIDLIRLRKYLVGAEPQIVEGNTDVNADTAVDLLDLVRMRKYFAQQDVILE